LQLIIFIELLQQQLATKVSVVGIQLIRTRMSRSDCALTHCVANNLWATLERVENYISDFTQGH